MKKLLAILLFIPSLARAEFWTGNDLYEKLRSTDVMDRVQGTGFVMGVYDAYVHLFFCPASEAGITVGQIADMVSYNLAANPNQRNKAAYFLVRDTFRKTWPCATNTPKERRNGA